MLNQLKLPGMQIDNNNNSKQICIAPIVHNFRGAWPGSMLVSRGNTGTETLGKGKCF